MVSILSSHRGTSLWGRVQGSRRGKATTKVDHRVLGTTSLKLASDECQEHDQHVIKDNRDWSDSDIF